MCPAAPCDLDAKKMMLLFSSATFLRRFTRLVYRLPIITATSSQHIPTFPASAPCRCPTLPNTSHCWQVTPRAGINLNPGSAVGHRQRHPGSAEPRRCVHPEADLDAPPRLRNPAEAQPPLSRRHRSSATARAVHCSGSGPDQVACHLLAPRPGVFALGRHRRQPHRHRLQALTFGGGAEQWRASSRPQVPSRRTRSPTCPRSRRS